MKPLDEDAALLATAEAFIAMHPPSVHQLPLSAAHQVEILRGRLAVVSAELREKRAQVQRVEKDLDYILSVPVDINAPREEYLEALEVRHQEAVRNLRALRGAACSANGSRWQASKAATCVGWWCGQGSA